jgi:hypothetical protein
MTENALFFVQIAAILQAAFTFFAAGDALYFHFWKHRLHKHRSSEKEHWLHTANAMLFPLTVYFLFCGNFTGALLWLGIAATLITFVIEFLDVAHEKVSRIPFGGVSAVEGVLHFGMGVLRAMAFGFLLASKPLESFSWNAPLVSPAAYPSWVVTMGALMFAASVPMALWHLVLVRWWPREKNSLHPTPVSKGMP